MISHRPFTSLISRGRETAEDPTITLLSSRSPMLEKRDNRDSKQNGTQLSTKPHGDLPVTAAERPIMPHALPAASRSSQPRPCPSVTPDAPDLGIAKAAVLEGGLTPLERSTVAALLAYSRGAADPRAVRRIVAHAHPPPDVDFSSTHRPSPHRGAARTPRTIPFLPDEDTPRPHQLDAHNEESFACALATMGASVHHLQPHGCKGVGGDAVDRGAWVGRRLVGASPPSARRVDPELAVALFGGDASSSGPGSAPPPRRSVSRSHPAVGQPESHAELPLAGSSLATMTPPSSALSSATRHAACVPITPIARADRLVQEASASTFPSQQGAAGPATSQQALAALTAHQVCFSGYLSLGVERTSFG